MEKTRFRTLEVFGNIEEGLEWSVLSLTLHVEEEGGFSCEGQAWPLWRGVVFPTGRASKRQLWVPTKDPLLWASGSFGEVDSLAVWSCRLVGTAGALEKKGPR